MRREDREFYQRRGLCRGCVPTLMCIILVVLVLFFVGCKSTEYVPVVENHTETIHHHDSVKEVDSVYSEKTTIIREVDSAVMAQYGIQLKAQERAWLIQTERLQREISRLKEMQKDSVSKQDSVPRIVIKEVEKKQNIGQRISNFFANIVMNLIVLIVLITVCWLVKIGYGGR